MAHAEVDASTLVTSLPLTTANKQRPHQPIRRHVDRIEVHDRLIIIQDEAERTRSITVLTLLGIRPCAVETTQQRRIRNRGRIRNAGLITSNRKPLARTIERLVYNTDVRNLVVNRFSAKYTEVMVGILGLFEGSGRPQLDEVNFLSLPTRGRI